MIKRNLISIIDGEEIARGNEEFVTDPFSLKVVASIKKIDFLDKPRNKQAVSVPLELLFKVFEKLSDWIQKNRGNIVSIAAEETGSPIKYHDEDIGAILEFLSKSKDYAASRSKDYVWQPKGKIALFLSANEPIILGTLPVLAGLLAGNEVWVKPSSKTPSVPYLIIKKLLELGVPSEALHVIFPSRGLAQKLISLGFFNTILSFGNYRTNRTLASLAATSGTEFICENEGNDWVYVDKSYTSSLQELAEILVKSFCKHNGQMCDGVRGILVDKTHYLSLLSEMRLLVSSVIVGDPQNKKSEIGVLLTDSCGFITKTIEYTQPISKEIINFKQQDNRVYPTIIVEPNHNAEIITSGLFGPIVWICPTSSLDEVISLYKTRNDFGLGFSIFSEDTAVINTLTTQISVSRININTNPVQISIFSPWGGVGKSGSDGPMSWIERLSNRKLLNYGQH